MVLFNHTYKDANWNTYKSNEIIVIWIIQNDKPWDKVGHKLEIYQRQYVMLSHYITTILTFFF